MPACAPLLLETTPDDQPRVACGVFGVLGVEDASEYVYLGLHALQHRGQDGCGIASWDGGDFHIQRHLGLVNDHFAAGHVASTLGLKGDGAIGHTRYTTQGKNIARNLQPFYGEWLAHDPNDPQLTAMAVAHNGNLTNSRTLRRDLSRGGTLFQSETDTEVIVHLAARSPHNDIEFRLLDALRKVEGGYAIVVLTQDKIIAARDPNGIRPLVVGKLDLAPLDADAENDPATEDDTDAPLTADQSPAPTTAFVAASETCALDIVGAELLRDVRPGEMLVAERGGDGWRSLEIAPVRRPPRTCAFEYLYFARPDSVVDGISVYEARKRLGALLAEETLDGVDVDIVVPVPDSGMPAAIGFAAQSQLPMELGLIRSHAVGRSFILSDQATRAHKVRLKHSANRAVLKGKSVVLVDDSIVRGTTSRKIVELVKRAGAAQVHFRSASPRIMYDDFYGIELSNEDTLFARAGRDLESMRKELGVESLGFLSLESLYLGICSDVKNEGEPQLCDHYFTKDYPTPLVDRDDATMGEVHQLSLLKDT